MDKMILQEKETIEKLMIAKEKATVLANEVGISEFLLTENVERTIRGHINTIVDYGKKYFHINIDPFRLRSEFNSYLSELESSLTQNDMVNVLKEQFQYKMKKATLNKNKIKIKELVYSSGFSLNYDFHRSADTLKQLLRLYGIPFNCSNMEYKQENENTNANALISIYAYANGSIDLIFKDQESAKSFYEWLNN